MVVGVRFWDDMEKKGVALEGVKEEELDIDDERSEEFKTGLPLPISDSSCRVWKSTTVSGRQSGPTRRSTKGGWTKEEDDRLARAVKQFKGKSWKKIAEKFPGRTDVQCLHHWQKVLDPELIKGPWTKEEDDHIIELVQKHGCKKWSAIAKNFRGRIGKQIREREVKQLKHVQLLPRFTKLCRCTEPVAQPFKSRDKERCMDNGGRDFVDPCPSGTWEQMGRNS